MITLALPAVVAASVAPDLGPSFGFGFYDPVATVVLVLRSVSRHDDEAADLRPVPPPSR